MVDTTAVGGVGWDRDRVRRWSVRTVALAALFVIAAVADPESTFGVVFPLVVEVVALAVFLVAALRMPAARRVWWMLWGSQLLVVCADLVYAYQDNVLGGVPFPGAADPLYVAAYVPQGIAIALLVRARHPRASTSQLLDSLIISVPVAAIAIVYVIVPVLSDDVLTLTSVLAVLYPVVDVVLLTGLIRLSVGGGGHRNRSLGLLTASVSATLIADLVYTGLDSEGIAMPGWLSAAYSAGVVLMTAAALSSDAPRVLLRDLRHARPGLSPGRMVALGMASISLPILLALGSGPGTGVDVAVFALGTVLINLLIVWRGVRVITVVDRQSRELAALARTDTLTGLPNRRSWDFEVQRAESWVLHTERPLVVAFLDLDLFKEYNDELGHVAGDELLARCATAWRSALPSRAYLARYGGEEFTILLPDTTARDALALLEDVRLVTPDGTTVSIGFAERADEQTVVEAVADADAALYAAKEQGRDRVVQGPSYGSAPPVRGDDLTARVNATRACSGGDAVDVGSVLGERGELALHLPVPPHA